MNELYETVVKYDKVQNDGLLKRVSEKYIINAASCADAEQKMTAEMASCIRGEFQVEACAKKKFAEVIHLGDNESDKWYICKVAFFYVDEVSGAEKKSTSAYLVLASGVDDALTKIYVNLKGSMISYELLSVVKSNYLDVFNLK